MTVPWFQAIEIPSVIDAEGDPVEPLTVEPDDSGRWLEIRHRELGTIYPDPQQCEALAQAILACAAAIRAHSQEVPA